MKTVFIKGGDYTPAIYFDTAGAINEIFNRSFNQMVRASSIFTLTRDKSGFSIIEGGEVREKTNVASTFSFSNLVAYLDKYKMIFFGIVVNESDVVSSHSVLARAEPFVFDEDEKAFINLVTSKKMNANHIVSLFHLFKLSNSNTYCCILNNLVTIDAFTVNGPSEGVFEEADCRLIFSDQGNSIRSKLLNPEFPETVVSMSYGYFLPTQSVCVKKGEPFSLKLFNRRYVIPDAVFLEGFKIEIKSPLEYQIEGDSISFLIPPTPQTSFISIQIKGSEFFDNITLGNSFEKLALNFLVLVY